MQIPNTCSSDPFAVTPWQTFLICAILGLVLVMLGALLPMDTLDIRPGSNCAWIIICL